MVLQTILKACTLKCIITIFNKHTHFVYLLVHVRMYSRSGSNGSMHTIHQTPSSSNHNSGKFKISSFKVYYFIV